jgi:hypothetical protein
MYLPVQAEEMRTDAAPKQSGDPSDPFVVGIADTNTATAPESPVGEVPVVEGQPGEVSIVEVPVVEVPVSGEAPMIVDAAVVPVAVDIPADAAAVDVPA